MSVQDKVLQERRVVQSALRIKEHDVILLSAARHDCYSHSKAPNWFLDGGTDYVRIGTPNGVNIPLETEDLTLYSDSSVSDVLSKACWGTYGISGDEELTYYLIKDMELSHLENVINRYSEVIVQGKLHPYFVMTLFYWYGLKKKSSTACYSNNY